MDAELVKSMEESEQKFLDSKDKTPCAKCGAPVYPTDEWVPHDRNFDIELGRFTFPKGVAHVGCVEAELES